MLLFFALGSRLMAERGEDESRGGGYSFYANLWRTGERVLS